MKRPNRSEERLAIPITPTPTVTATPLFSARAQASRVERTLTRYGSDTEITLSDYLDSGVSGVTFAFSSCDASRADYYDSVAVDNGKLKPVIQHAGPCSRIKHAGGDRMRGSGDR